MLAHLVRQPPTSLQKQIGGYMRQTTSDLLVYNLQFLTNTTIETFQAGHLGVIWHHPLEKNATDRSDRADRILEERQEKYY